MFTIHYNISKDELDAIQLGDIVAYGGGSEGKVIKITKEKTTGSGDLYVFYFENGHKRPVIVYEYPSRKSF
ncbi:MAG: hypothetical protein EOO85_31150 [Pedobacter sp.]|nr:MAG: hypothetical protein EOO85_31150 [Pedobacter sp.]